MAETHFDDWLAENYERLWPQLLDPSLLDDAVEFLAGLADDGPVLEFGIGTGRIAMPLAQRGLAVTGIELSEPMVRRLEREKGDAEVQVMIGDFATTRVEGSFSLVYLVRNSITNLTTLEEQIEAFHNAAAHLEPSGHFVIENYVPNLRRLPPGETRMVFDATPTHVGVEDYIDEIGQVAISQHWWTVDGQLHTMTSPHRYAWPAELDLMARLAGMMLIERWANWDRSPFTAESASHISVWRK